MYLVFFFFSSRRRHTRLQGDWSSDVCSSDLHPDLVADLHEFLHGRVARERIARLGQVHGEGPDGAVARDVQKGHGWVPSRACQAVISAVVSGGGGGGCKVRGAGEGRGGEEG